MWTCFWLCDSGSVMIDLIWFGGGLELTDMSRLPHWADPNVENKVKKFTEQYEENVDLHLVTHVRNRHSSQNKFSFFSFFKQKLTFSVSHQEALRHVFWKHFHLLAGGIVFSRGPGGRIFTFGTNLHLVSSRKWLDAGGWRSRSLWPPSQHVFEQPSAWGKYFSCVKAPL